MGKFFSRFKADSADPSVSSLGNLANFYSLLLFLIAIPFVLIVLLVWLTSFLGLTVWLFAGFAAICAWIGWRLYRRWGGFKAKMADQSSEFHDLMREVAKSGKNVEIALLNGMFTLRYQGQDGLPTSLPGRPQTLALAAPPALEAEAEEVLPFLPAERFREELEGFIRLRDDGVISPEEFDRLKACLLQRISA